MAQPSSKEILQRGVHELKSNRRDGARVLATSAVQCLRSVLSAEIVDAGDKLENREGDRSLGDLFEALCCAVRELKRARPSMGAPISSALVRALSLVERKWREQLKEKADTNAEWDSIKDADTVAEMGRAGCEVLDDYLTARNADIDRLADGFTRWVLTGLEKHKRPPSSAENKRIVSILTLSASSTITACINRLIQSCEVTIDLRILESRPGFEGAKFGIGIAQKLRHLSPSEPIHKNSRVQIGPDCAAGLLGEGIEMVLIGADRLSEHGDVSNKIGSLPAVLSAKERSPQCQVVVLYDNDKIAPPGALSEHEIEENEPSEITDVWPADLHVQDSELNLTVRNVYFEWVQSRHIDVYFCSDQRQDRESIQQQSQAIKALEDKYGVG
jgi:translation initiation factor 2B subunit (eIF-2B alpha/beta/delta family)